jgi:hypothetical protein
MEDWWKKGGMAERAEGRNPPYSFTNYNNNKS